jgi:hypothetical protein
LGWAFRNRNLWVRSFQQTSGSDHRYWIHLSTVCIDTGSSDLCKDTHGKKLVSISCYFFTSPAIQSLWFVLWWSHEV